MSKIVEMIGEKCYNIGVSGMLMQPAYENILTIKI